jgi:hypothetical protein
MCCLYAIEVLMAIIRCTHRILYDIILYFSCWILVQTALSDLLYSVNQNMLCNMTVIADIISRSNNDVNLRIIHRSPFFKWTSKFRHYCFTFQIIKLKSYPMSSILEVNEKKLLGTNKQTKIIHAKFSSKCTFFQSIRN